MVTELAEIFEKLCNLRRGLEGEQLLAAVDDAISATGAAIAFAAKASIDNVGKPEPEEEEEKEDKGGGFL